MEKITLLMVGRTAATQRLHRLCGHLRPSCTEATKPVLKVAVVTGAGSGIGRACAVALASDGFTVVLAGRCAHRMLRPNLTCGFRQHDTLQQTADAIATLGGPRALAVVTDVSEPESVARLFDQCRQQFGRCDVLFNNAGRGAPAVPMEEISWEQWQSVLAVNLSGAFLCTQQAMKLMKTQQPRGGRIINNGSVSASTPRPLSAPYTATKHAITGLTKSTALDGREWDIAAGQIDIGNTATDMTQKMGQGVLQPSGDTRVEPTMDVKHAAAAVRYMASLPLDANVLSMTVMASKMPFVGRG